MREKESGQGTERERETGEKKSGKGTKREGNVWRERERKRAEN